MNQIAKAFTSCARRVFRQCLLVNCGLGLPVTDPLNSSPPATSLARSSSSFAFSTYQLALLPPDLRPSQPPPVTPESSPYIPTCKLSTDFLPLSLIHRLVFRISQLHLSARGRWVPREVVFQHRPGFEHTLSCFCTISNGLVKHQQYGG